MGRPLRIEYEGAVYHVIARGNARSDIYLSDSDRELFLDILAYVVDDSDGYAMQTIAEFAGMHHSTVSRLIKD